MPFDLVIRNGTVIDGSGQPGHPGDVAIVGDRIAEIGRVDESGRREIDAEGHVVTPGFIDGHTHMDAQVFWDPLGTNSCWHGVTSVIMGNCGFTLAPARPGEHKLLVDNLEKAEDIPAATIAAGVPWTWESFPEYLDAVERTPKGINYTTQIGHSALRTAVMGERAFGGEATEDDMAAMEALLRSALEVGAIGLTTSVSRYHETPDGRPVASRSSSWEEIARLVRTVGDVGTGVFQLALETDVVESDDLALAMTFYSKLRDLAIETKVPTTYGLRRQHLDAQLSMFDEVGRHGGSMFGQSQSIYATAMFSFLSRMPFEHLPVWRPIRALPADEQVAAMRDGAVRERLIRETNVAVSVENAGPWAKTRPLEEYEIMRGAEPYRSVGEVARARGVSAIEVIIDLALETELGQIFRATTSPEDERHLLASMAHPRSIMTFSDSGAHVKMVAGGELHTHLLGHWVREREAFTIEEAVRMITLAPTEAWGLRDRGMLREGLIADVNVFDPATIGPDVPAIVFDLPAGAQRIAQKATGIRSTIVSGREVFAHGEHTGELPGRLIRGARPNSERH